MEIKFEGGKKVNAVINGRVLKTDQPLNAGGEGSAPTPFELFLASIGTCAGIYVKGFCDQRGINTDNIHIQQQMEWDPVRQIMGKIHIEISVPVDFPEKYESAMVNAANLCTVKRHLKEDLDIKVFATRRS